MVKTSTQTQTGCQLKAVFEFTPPEACLANRENGEPVDVKVSIAEGETRCEWVLADRKAGVEYVEVPPATCEECVWPSVDRSGCFFRILGVTAGRIVTAVHFTDRTAYETLLEALTTTCKTVRTITLVEPDGESESLDDHRVTVQLSTLTEKEWEALELAIAEGYYEKPRKVTLTDLAAEFDVTTSAISQRLNSAETKIIGQLFTGE